MALLPESDQIKLQLKQLESKAKQLAHRYLVVFSGDAPWVKAALACQLPNLSEAHTLIVSDQHLDLEGEYIQTTHVKQYLGSEVERLVWNGFSGINPDNLGAASGLIKGGGLLFLMLPDLSKVAAQPDPDYLRMCSRPDELPNYGTRFLERMVKLIASDTDITVFSQSTAVSARKTSEKDSQALPISPPALDQCTPDQLKMIEAILTVSKGHRKRPLVVHADRGRGKTSALGLAAARIVKEDHVKVLITAPSRRACDAAFKHYQQQTSKLEADAESQLEFVAPDELVEQLPSCHILFVDEAAAIPAPQLKQMLEAYSRIVFSSTTHGYEGTGQGFTVRFRHTLDTLTPQWKSLTLNQPVRWNAGDPLERWVFEFLLLNAQIATLTDPETIAGNAHEAEWISQQQLAQNNSLLKQLTALLVNAHYQTSPSDIRMILDHPKLHIGLIQESNQVVAAVLLLEEGGVDDPLLAQNIIQGTRRPKGHLVPQALTSSSANPEILKLRTYRIMRIAVHPDVTNQGIGSKLIEAAVALGQQDNIDYLSASFGFTEMLNCFWLKNEFRLIRIGYHKDAASGAQSAIVVRVLQTETEKVISRTQSQFQQHFISGLNTIYRTLDTETCLGTLHTFARILTSQTRVELKLIALFAHQSRSFEDSAPVLFSFVLDCFSSKLAQQLLLSEQQLLCMRVLQGRSIITCIKLLKLNGKKQLDQTIRAAISKLLALHSPIDFPLPPSRHPSHQLSQKAE